MKMNRITSYNVCYTKLLRLGGKKARPVFRGIWFEADKPTFYKIVYLSRLVSRVLVPLIEFDCKDKDDLYKGAIV